VRPVLRRVACAAACALFSLPLQAQEEGLFELRLTAVPQSRTVAVLLDAAGEPMVPLLRVLDFLEVPVTREGEALLLEWPPGSWSTRIDRATRTVTSGGTAFTAPPEGWLARGDEIFVALPVLERIIAGRVRADWENLGLLVTGRDDYPVVRRLQNQERRRPAAGARLPEDAEIAVDYPARSGGATLGWGFTSSLQNQEVQGSGRAALGTALLGGSLETGGSMRSEADGARFADPTLRYTRSFPRGRWLRQLEVGDVPGGGPIVRPYLGIAVSNEPLFSPRYFGDALVRPVVPAGWEYEVYQGEHLVGVSTRGADQPVPIPIGYGTTPVRIRMLGPAGQERTEELVYLVPAVQVPAGEVRYALGGGVCRRRDCSATGHVDLGYGVSRSLTVGAGADHTTTDTGSVTRPFASVSFTPTPSMRTELRVRPGTLAYGAIHRHHRLGGWRIAGGWTHEEGGYRLPAPTRFAEGNASIGTPLPGRGRVLTVYARGRDSDSLPSARWQVGANSGFRSLHVGVSHEHGQQLRDITSLQLGAPLPRHLLPALRTPQLNGRIDLAGTEVHALSLGASFRPVDRANVTAAVSWHAQGGAPGIALGVVTRTRAAYVQGHTFAEHGRYGGYTSAGGGIAFGTLTDVVTSPFETIGRAGVTGVVFLDDDGDGGWGTREEPARGIPVVVGGERVVTDERGVFRAWGLFPYRVVGLGVDTLNLQVTNLSAAHADHRVRPTPNVYARMDLPLIRTREAIGRVAWEGVPRVTGGITVEAVATSGVVHRVSTFSDGEYYFPRLPAGSYTLRISASSLQALGARAPEASLVIPGGAGDGPVRAPALVLTPAR
jgi:hypothetical protein